MALLRNKNASFFCEHICSYNHDFYNCILQDAQLPIVGPTVGVALIGHVISKRKIILYRVDVWKRIIFFFDCVIPSGSKWKLRIWGLK